MWFRHGHIWLQVRVLVKVEGGAKVQPINNGLENSKACYVNRLEERRLVKEGGVNDFFEDLTWVGSPERNANAGLRE